MEERSESSTEELEESCWCPWTGLGPGLRLEAGASNCRMGRSAEGSGLEEDSRSADTGAVGLATTPPLCASGTPDKP